VSQDLLVNDLQIGEDVGSDHRAVILDFQLTQ